MASYIVFNAHTGEMVNYVRRVCKCGHVITFLSRHPVTCTRCGRLVYPTQKFEFMEKMKKEMRKKKHE